MRVIVVESNSNTEAKSLEYGTGTSRYVTGGCVFEMALDSKSFPCLLGVLAIDDGPGVIALAGGWELSNSAAK